MSPLPRAAVALAVAALPSVALAGCRTSVSLNREAVVAFKPGSTAADRDRVRAECGSASRDAVAETPGPGTLKSSRVNDVRFRIDHAGDAELAALYACLYRDPAVRGVTVPDFGG